MNIIKKTGRKVAWLQQDMQSWTANRNEAGNFTAWFAISTVQYSWRLSEKERNEGGRLYAV